MYSIDYVDLSEANIHAGTAYSSWSYPYWNDYPDNYLDSDWMGGRSAENDDDSWYGPITIVLPMTLEEFKCATKGNYLKIYSEQTTPFKTTIDNYYGGECKFYVPSGTRKNWIEKTTYPDNVMFIDGPTKDVTVGTAGQLASLLTDSEIETMNVLTVRGKINAKDFTVLKRMSNLLKLSIYATWEVYEGHYGPVEDQTYYRSAEVPAYVFQNHENLQSVSLRISTGFKGLLIGDYAFDGCTQLKSFDCEGVSSLGDFCFRNTKVKGAMLLGTKYTEYYNGFEEGTYTMDNREFEHIGLQPFFGVKGTSSPWNYARYESEWGWVDDTDYADYLYDLDNFSVIPSFWASFNYNTERPYYSGVTNKDETLLYSINTTQGYDLSLPSSICTLADYAISGLQLRSINLGHVTTIGDGFLYQCHSLQTITCDNTVYKSVDGVLFTRNMKTLVKYPCAKNATSFRIPSTVELISKWAFEGSQNLNTVYIDATTPPALADLAFDDFDVTNVKLYVPVGSLAAYQAANYWNGFKDIEEYVVNDVNRDGDTDVVDVVDIARYTVGSPAETFVKVLADINYDGNVNVADAVVLVNEIAGDTNWSRRMRAPQSEHNDVLKLTENDDNSLSWHIEGNGRYTAFQFDLYLPEDVDVTQMQLNSQRKQKHQLLYNKVREGQWRVVALSTSNREFEGVAGELLNIELDGFATADVLIDNIHFVTAQGTDVMFDAVSLSRGGMTTKVNTLPVDAENSQSVYSLSGQRLNTPRKGLNIVGGKKVIIK